jgi:hypothetical protein
MKYRQDLKGVFGDLDHMLRRDVPKFADALEQSLNDVGQK